MSEVFLFYFNVTIVPRCNELLTTTVVCHQFPDMFAWSLSSKGKPQGHLNIYPKKLGSQEYRRGVMFLYKLHN